MIKHKFVRGDVFFVMDGELDQHVAHLVRNYVDEVLDTCTYNSVIFDMSNLDFMDSTGIGVLLGRYRRLMDKNIDMYILNPTPSIDKILRISGIYEIIQKIISEVQNV